MASAPLPSGSSSLIPGAAYGKDPSELLSHLFLVGTVHGDPNGFRRSLRLLQFLKADLILVELSPFALSFRQAHQQHFQQAFRSNLEKAAESCSIPIKDGLRHPEITAIRRQISLPFEYRAASKYALRNEATLIPVDYSVFSRRWIETWPELISIENLVSLLSLPPHARSVESIYKAAASRIASDTQREVDRLIEKGKWTEKLWEERERFMGEQVLKALQEFWPERAVFLGGWWHLTLSGTTPTLRTILGVPSKRCYLLNQDIP